MKKVEILLATMNRKDFALLETMNIQSNIIIANQTNCNTYQERLFNNNIAKMICTADRGVGRNRNIALAYSSADICIFADDDMEYTDGYTVEVVKAFEKLPDADMLIFDCKYKQDEVCGRKEKEVKNARPKRVRLYNFARHGTYKIAIKRSAWKRHNVWFSELYGGGAVYGSGEDTLFLREALKKGMKIYTYPYEIAFIDQSSSTWFSGYNEKFFFDKGSLVATAFPMMKWILWIYFWFVFFRKSNFSKRQCAKLMQYGMKAQKESVSYKEWFGK